MNRIYLALTAIALSGAALAADLTLTLTPQHMNRAQAAVGQILMLRTPDTPAVVTPDVITKPAVITNGVITTPAVITKGTVTPVIQGAARDATNAEVKKYLADQLRIVVRQHERGKKIDAAQTEADALPTVDIQ